MPLCCLLYQFDSAMRLCRAPLLLTLPISSCHVANFSKPSLCGLRRSKMGRYMQKMISILAGLRPPLHFCTKTIALKLWSNRIRFCRLKRNSLLYLHIKRTKMFEQGRCHICLLKKRLKCAWELVKKDTYVHV